MVKFETNFTKYPAGNGIGEGSTLHVKVHGAEVVTGQIRDNQNKVITIDQSHS